MKNDILNIEQALIKLRIISYDWSNLTTVKKSLEEVRIFLRTKIVMEENGKLFNLYRYGFKKIYSSIYRCSSSWLF